jgi:hypothetical protein
VTEQRDRDRGAGGEEQRDQPHGRQTEQPGQSQSLEPAEGFGGLTDQRLGELELLIGIWWELGKFGLCRGILEALAEAGVAAEGSLGGLLDREQLVACELPLGEEGGVMGFGLLDFAVAFAVGFEECTLDLKDPTGLLIGDGFEASVKGDRAGLGDSVLALLRVGLESLAGGLGSIPRLVMSAVVLGFELLSGMLVLPIQPGEIALAGLLEIAGLGGVGLDALPQLGQEFQGPVPGHEFIHNPS